MLRQFNWDIVYIDTKSRRLSKMQKPTKRRRGLLASVKKNAEAVSRAKALLAVSKASGAFATSSSSSRGKAPRAPRARRQGNTGATRKAPSRARMLLQTREATSPPRALLSSVARSSSSSSSPPPSRARKRDGDLSHGRGGTATLPYEYYVVAARYEEVLGQSWDPLPGIRLFLDGHACLDALRAAAEVVSQNDSVAPVWAPGRKFYHVKEHKTRFPVLCEYLKTWHRRRGEKKSDPPGDTAAAGEISVTKVGGKANGDGAVADSASRSLSPATTTTFTSSSSLQRPTSPQSPALPAGDPPISATHSTSPAPADPALAEHSPSNSAPAEHATSEPAMPQPFETDPPPDSVALPLDLTHKHAVGALVTAYFKKSKKWYPGKLWHVNLDGSIDVLFDDGDRRNSMPAPLVRIDPSRGGTASLPDVDSDDEDTEPAATVQSPRGRAKNKRAGSTSLVPGTPVRARHKLGWKYFSGKVTSTDPIRNTVDVLYDDGEAETGLPRAAVKALNMHLPSAAAGGTKRLGLPVRTRVEAKFGGKKKWFRGVLMKPVKGMQEGRYRVQYDDGDIEDMVKRKHLWCVKPRTEDGERESGALDVGDVVEARHNHGLEWFDATIAGKTREKSGLTSYDLLYSDGDEEKQVERWLIRKKIKKKKKKMQDVNPLLPTSPPIFCSRTHEYEGKAFVVTVHEVEGNEEGDDGSTDLFLMRVEGMSSKGPPRPGTVAAATISIPDSKLMGVLINGGLTEAQIHGFSPQDLAQELVDMVDISKKEDGSLKIALE